MEEEGWELGWGLRGEGPGRLSTPLAQSQPKVGQNSCGMRTAHKCLKLQPGLHSGVWSSMGDTPSPLTKKMSLFSVGFSFLRSRALPSPVPQLSSDSFLNLVGASDSLA